MTQFAQRLTCILFLSILVASPGFSQSSLDDGWSESSSDEHAYTIFYRDRYEADLELVHEWADYTFEVAEDEYAIILPQLDIYLVPVGETFRHETGAVWTALIGEAIHYSGNAPWIGLPATGSITEHIETNDTLPTALGQAQDTDSVVAKNVVHETFHHLQYTLRDRIMVDRLGWGQTIQSYQFPSWFLDGGAELYGWRDSPDRDEMFELLLDKIDGERPQSYACCWGVGTTPMVSFGGVYRQPWLFLVFVEERCGENFYKDVLLTQENTFQTAWDSAVTSCGETTVSLFREFQGWFETHRPSEDGIAQIPDTQDQEDAKRLRRLVELLRELLALTTG